VALGNSMTDPFVQFHFFAKMVWGNSYGVKGISPALFKTMLGHSKGCFVAIQECQDDTTKCAHARTLCTSVFFSPYVNAGKDIYDVREPHCNVLPYCYDFRAAKAFYRKPSTRKALGVRPQSLEWAVCNFAVNSDFNSDWMKDFADRLPPLLDAGVKVLVYAGDADYICNWMGNKAWTLGLEWPGKKEFNDASDQKWYNKTDGKKLGEVRTARDLTFVRVYDCGHMVPLEKPALALQMITEWMKDEHIVPPQLPPPASELTGVDKLLTSLHSEFPHLLSKTVSPDGEHPRPN
jgi:cathepsin A (carboxypeptidase C)